MAKSQSTEPEFSREIAQFLQGKLAGAGLNAITVAERVKVLKDLTIGMDRDNRWRLIAGFQQQDIVFFSPQQCIPLADFQSKVMRIDKYDRTGQKSVVIPLLICELKLGSSVNTHAMITYSSISAQLKSIFPHCAYYFVMDTNQARGMKPETVLRHSKGFDRVFLNWYRERDKVWEAIQAHFEYLTGLGLMPAF